MAHFTTEFRYVQKEDADRWCAVLNVQSGAELFFYFDNEQDAVEYCVSANEVLMGLHQDREVEA